MKRLTVLLFSTVFVLPQCSLAQGPPNEHLRWGNPGGPGQLLVKKYYVISHHSDWKIPIWTAVHMTAYSVTGTEERTNDFRPDTELLEGQRAELGDYASVSDQHIQRGHMVEADALARLEESMSETFLLSNMIPQHRHTNVGRWRVIEGEVRELAVTRGSIWVFSGPAFLASEDSSRVEPTVQIGPNQVAVPTHTFKVVLAELGSGQYEMYAFLVANVASGHSGHNSDEYLVSVDEVEAWTGLDFFSALPDSIEWNLERTKVETWPIQP